MEGGSYLTTDVWVSNVGCYSTPLSVAELQEHYRTGLTGGRLDTTGTRIGEQPKP
jgi:hypothetical protein